jgi:hypothetical protein
VLYPAELRGRMLSLERDFEKRQHVFAKAPLGLAQNGSIFAEPGRDSLHLFTQVIDFSKETCLIAREALERFCRDAKPFCKPGQISFDWGN